MSYEVISLISSKQPEERFAILDTSTDRLVQDPGGRTRKFATLAAAVSAVVKLRPGHTLQSARARASKRAGPDATGRHCVVCKQTGHDRRNCPRRSRALEG